MQTEEDDHLFNYCLISRFAERVKKEYRNKSTTARANSFVRTFVHHTQWHCKRTRSHCFNMWHIPRHIARFGNDLWGSIFTWTVFRMTGAINDAHGFMDNTHPTTPTLLAVAHGPYPAGRDYLPPSYSVVGLSQDILFHLKCPACILHRHSTCFPQRSVTLAFRLREWFRLGVEIESGAEYLLFQRYFLFEWRIEL